ncbi:GNAT family N-acetyltransferase [Allomuricauda sp. SCSIO 65647]|uniref:GNAT family N-acetyltransferase n=1 Tax=Allomuricauda sp. SCSIO 65647 TaxID=2908843 RepID=UPI001F463DAA|nr:GNAT family N-acetyltransferase [Muricauda sp. SCSIO 65647]UJH67723.1 GNAT family N-acetyltransferase [Muricauda sp. SCSIO 65647]
MKIRKATKTDLTAIIEMLANDVLGSQREQFKDPLPEAYLRAFEKIDADPNHELVVIDDELGKVVGTLQLSFLQYLTYQGGIRAQIEQVRIHESQRGQGLGKKLFEWAINRAREKGAHVVQLTTDKQRPQARKFYEGLGFKASHEGMKRHL